MNSLNQCSEAEAEPGKGTGESQDPFEAGAWLEGGWTSGAARSQQGQVSRCFLTQGRSHRGGRVTPALPTSLQTSPMPQLGSLWEGMGDATP